MSTVVTVMKSIYGLYIENYYRVFMINKHFNLNLIEKDISNDGKIEMYLEKNNENSNNKKENIYIKQKPEGGRISVDRGKILS